MTPAEEIEHIIKEFETCKIAKSYMLKSFPEIHVVKYDSYYKVGLINEFRKDCAVIERLENVAQELNNMKITIENKIIDRDRIITIYEIDTIAFIKIYYKNCLFTDETVVYGKHFENCIIEGGKL